MKANSCFNFDSSWCALYNIFCYNNFCKGPWRKIFGQCGHMCTYHHAKCNCVCLFHYSEPHSVHNLVIIEFTNLFEDDHSNYYLVCIHPKFEINLDPTSFDHQAILESDHSQKLPAAADLTQNLHLN